MVYTRSQVHLFTAPFPYSDPMIMITDVDLFDYSAGEPAPEVLTVLRALEVALFFLVTLCDELTFVSLDFEPLR